MNLRSVNSLAVLGVWLIALPAASAHRVDEYLQATRLSIELERVELEMDLTPGIALASEVFSWIDTNRDGRISNAEGDAYARQVLNSVALAVDGRQVRVVLGEANFPEFREMSLGVGTIRLRASANVPAANAGRHQISFLNTHRPESSVYLVNALVPANPRIEIADQRRDRAQHGVTLDYTVAPGPASAQNFMLLAGLVVVGRLVLRGRGRLPRFGIVVAIAACGLARQSRAETGLRDPEFSRLPFEQWLAEGERTGINWSAEILPAELSTHQRLMLRVVIRVDGRFLEKHRGPGKFVTLVQYKDHNEQIWQNHTSLDLSKLATGIGTHQLAIAQYAFVLPGDYALAIAVCETATLEHNLIFRQVHAEPLKAEPLPDAWAGLPAVEFIPAVTEPPDVWYLPGIEHGLNLSLTTRRRIHIHVLVNTTPSAADSIAAMQANMSAAIPAMKVFSQIDIRNGALDIAFLDLTHRRVELEQRNVRSLAWEGVRNILLGAKPGLIDVRDLEGQSKMQEFFRDEVSRRLGGVAARSDDAEFQVVIVLSGPAFLKDQEPLSPLDAPRDADHRLFYIRFVNYPAVTQSRKGRRGAMPITTQFMPVDDLERTVEPLHARLSDATSVEEFRRILADVLDQISRI